MDRSRFLAHVNLVNLLVAIAAVLVVSACTVSTGGTGGTPTATPPPTHTPTPSCATLLPGAIPATTITGFSEVRFPTGAVDTAPQQTYGGAGQFKILAYNVCYSGTQDDLTGPFSGHHSVTAYLLGAGWGTSLTFPYMGEAQQTCPHFCYSFSGDQRYLALEQITDHGTNLITYTLRLAAPPALPNCDPTYYPNATPYSIYYDSNAASIYHFQLPPLSKLSNFLGGGHAGGTDHPICSAGTYPTIIAFMNTSVTAAGWKVSNLSATGFTAQIMQSGRTYEVDVSTNSGLINTANEWVLTVHAPM